MEEPEGVGFGRIPLTPYDILGYVTPGSTFLICVLAFEYCVRDLLLPLVGSKDDIDTPLLSTLRNLYRAGLETDTWVSLALLGIAVLGVAYVAGHIIASFSSFLVDRVLIYKGYGYPYEILLGFRDGRRSRSDYSGAFYRGLFFWLNAYLASRYALLFLKEWVEGRSIHPFLSSFVALSGWLISIAVPLKLLVSLVDHWTSGRDQVGKVYGPLLGAAKKFIVIVFAGPYDLIAKFLGGILNTRRSFTAEFISRYKMWFERCFSMEAEQAQTNNFWYAYSYVMRNSGILTSRLNHWLTLYMFSRNLSTAFYIAFVYCFAWLYLSSTDIYAKSHGMVGEILALPLGFLLLSFAMLIRFYYLFVCRFTKVVFKSFVFLNEVEVHDKRGTMADS